MKKGKPAPTPGPPVNVLRAPAGVNNRIALGLPESATKRLPDVSKATPRGAPILLAKGVFDPPGVILTMVPALVAETKRLPELSKASANGSPKPEANGVLVPPGVHLKILPLLLSS